MFLSFSFTKKINLCQKFDVKVIYFGFKPELVHHLSSILSFAKIFKELGIQNMVCSICNNLSINIVTDNLYVNRKFKNCLHGINIWITVFVLKDSSGLEIYQPNSPVFFTWVKKIDSNLLSLC